MSPTRHSRAREKNYQRPRSLEAYSDSQYRVGHLRVIISHALHTINKEPWQLTHMQTCPAACGRALEAPYYPTVAVPRVTQRSAEHAARVRRRGHEALLHGLGQVLERARGVVEEDRVGLAVGADCAPRGASTCEAAARATGDGAAAARACTVAIGGGVGGEGAPSRIMSKYCVTIMRSMTVFASTSCTSETAASPSKSRTSAPSRVEICARRPRQ